MPPYLLTPQCCVEVLFQHQQQNNRAKAAGWMAQMAGRRPFSRLDALWLRCHRRLLCPRDERTPHPVPPVNRVAAGAATQRGKAVVRCGAGAAAVGGCCSGGGSAARALSACMDAGEQQALSI